ncbi:MAG TPA: outer membrane beta-barrel protein [Thermoanaerobaculia bacterium]|nr:outer membrane beta-barrel protein [Thermoanaerobaculia bacterium]
MSLPAILATVLIALPSAAAAESGRSSLGARGMITVADGEPANDIPGFGVFAGYRLNDRWSLGLSVDRTEYDFEEPARLVGLAQDPSLDPIDVIAEATVFQLELRRSFERLGGRWVWFVGAGLGAASIDVPDAQGALAGSGTFDIETEADTEVVASLLGGLQRRFGDHWFLELALRADQHFADWQLVDRVSGARGAVDDYIAYGGYFGLGFRF